MGGELLGIVAPIRAQADCKSATWQLETLRYPTSGAFPRESLPGPPAGESQGAEHWEMPLEIHLGAVGTWLVSGALVEAAPLGGAWTSFVLVPDSILAVFSFWPQPPRMIKAASAAIVFFIFIRVPFFLGFVSFSRARG